MQQQNQILKKFYSSKKLKFSELNENFPTNKFSYYIKQLIKKGFVEKKNNFYQITDKGEKYICYLDKYENFSLLEQPIHDIFLLPKRGNKYLIQKRTKRPFLGVSIPIGGKIKSGESIFETAERKLKEDTGLTGDLKFKGIVDVKTIKNNEVYLHHILNVFLVSNLKGEVLKETSKGKNFWISEKDYYKLKNRLSAAEEHFEIVKSKSFMLLELRQYLNKNGKFVKAEIIRKMKI
jgi:ADP-ribose pyrophosphatase YjhB (NUDIX family)/predicted transcriptional regulator